MGLTGAQKSYLETTDVPPGQIDLLDGMSEDPAYEHIDLAQSLFTDPELRGLRDDILDMLENEELLNSFAEQTREDPALMDRINYLIENDPEKLRTELLPQFEEDPDQMASLLNETVSAEQAQEQAEAAAAQSDPTIMIQQLLNQFGDMFESFTENFSMENLGQVMLGFVNGMYAMASPFLNGISEFAGSSERVTAGNGGPDGPAAQAREVAAATGVDYGPDGQPLEPATRPEPAPETGPEAGPDAGPGAETRVAQNEPGQSPGPGGSWA